MVSVSPMKNWRAWVTPGAENSGEVGVLKSMRPEYTMFGSFAA